MAVKIIITVLIILVVLLVVLYFVGKKLQKKQAEQQAQIEAAKQTVTMLVIDKKKLKLKDAGFPAVVLEQTPKYMRRAKFPIVKAKIGPQIMSLICDASIFDIVPVKKEVKATVSGIYITDVKGIRGKLNTAPAKKKENSVIGLKKCRKKLVQNHSNKQSNRKDYSTCERTVLMTYFICTSLHIKKYCFWQYFFDVCLSQI